MVPGEAATWRGGKKWSQLITLHVLSSWMENGPKISCVSEQPCRFRWFSQLSSPGFYGLPIRSEDPGQGISAASFNPKGVRGDLLSLYGHSWPNEVLELLSPW